MYNSYISHLSMWTYDVARKEARFPYIRSPYDYQCLTVLDFIGLRRCHIKSFHIFLFY